MATGAGDRPKNTSTLSALFDTATEQLRPRLAPASAGDGFLYSGNRHESVPRALFLDRRLTPLERNAWQVFRLLLNDDGVTAFPTYDQLRPYLASMPCAGPASHETVARALTVLRLTRWLSLVRRRRDRATGRILGNLYVLHDEPLTPFEAMQLDPDYLGLVSQALTHAAKTVQIVGANTLREVQADPRVSGRVLPSRLQVLAERLAQPERDTESYPQLAPGSDSEDGDLALLRNREPPSSESELGRKPAPDLALRNPKKDSTVRTGFIKEVRTVLSAENKTLHYPERFQRLPEAQRAGALMALRQVDAAQRQAVLDEWSTRCARNAVRNPAAYLFGIIQKALKGEFKVWVGHDAPGAAVIPSGLPNTAQNVATDAAPAQAPAVTTSREEQAAMAQAYLAKIRKMLPGGTPRS